MKRFFIILAVLGIGYLVVFKTPFIYNSTDTYSKWLARHVRISQGDEREPGFIFSQDNEAIKDDYVAILNRGLLEVVHPDGLPEDSTEWRIEKMAWREGDHLFVVNPSTLMMVSPNVMIDEWKSGIQAIRTGSKLSPEHEGFYYFAMLFFDAVTIRSGEPLDGLGMKWKDTDTSIDIRFGDDRDDYKP